MKYEFLEAYENIFQHSFKILPRALKIKMKAIRYCNRMKKKMNTDGK
jgi:hypothetical protein